MSSKMNTLMVMLWILVMPLTSCEGPANDTVMIDRGIRSGKQSDTLRFTVITEDEVYKKIHKKIHAQELPPPEAPAVDFQSSLVLFVTIGENPSTGYGIDIGAVTRFKQILKVKIRMYTPSPGKFYATVITQPYVILEVKEARGLKKVVFQNQAGRVIETLLFDNHRFLKENF